MRRARDYFLVLFLILSLVLSWCTQSYAKQSDSADQALDQLRLLQNRLGANNAANPQGNTPSTLGALQPPHVQMGAQKTEDQDQKAVNAKMIM